MGVVDAVSADTLLPVSEVFGPTFQGEGPYAGVRTGFVRLGLCNLHCEWCDTPYTWDTSRYDVDKECPDTRIGEVHDRLLALDVRTVCLSGGEPLMQRAKLDQLMVADWYWHVETNGTIPPPPYWREHVQHTTVSPKINTTSDSATKRIKLGSLAAWAALAWEGEAIFKFVCATTADLERVARVVQLAKLDPSTVWVMPQGTTAREVLTRHRALADRILERGWNTTTRLHTLLYGEERGR